MTSTPKLLASGRDADIFDAGPGLVLRRSRSGRRLDDEARIMVHLHERGYPVPGIERLSDDGIDLVMERFDGITMVDALARRPWRIRRFAATLADLHERLHAIDAPGWLQALPDPTTDQILHLDLHPLNVLVGPAGVSVIDWANVSRGHWTTDVGLTWLLTGAGTIPPGTPLASLIRLARRRFVASFIGHFDRSAVVPRLAGLAEWKCTDPNIDGTERDAIRRIAQQA